MAITFDSGVRLLIATCARKPRRDEDSGPPLDIRFYAKFGHFDAHFDVSVKPVNPLKDLPIFENFQRFRFGPKSLHTSYPGIGGLRFDFHAVSSPFDPRNPCHFF